MYHKPNSIHKSDSKKIFKHYSNMPESELENKLKNIKKHTSRMSKIGIHTTPEHEQSIKYHLAEARTKAIKKKTPSLEEMHKRSAEDFEKLSPAERETQAKADRDKSREEMIKKLKAAGDWESVKALTGK